MRAVRLIVLSIAGLILAGLASSAAIAQPAERDCRDFASQSEAQAVLRADPTDPNGLDDDEDGVACDEFDYGPAVGTLRGSAATSGSASSGSGSTGSVRTADASGAIAKTGTSSAELVLLGIGAILLGALIVRIAWGPVVLAPVAATRANRLLTTTLDETER
jgi:hypothetical protein